MFAPDQKVPALPECLSHEDLTDDALTGSLRVLQRAHGHRYSLDDTLTAYVAAQVRPSAPTVLDLGCGIGSVTLMLAHALPDARVLGLEAQALSFALAEVNVARNQLTDRVLAHRGDLRDANALQALLAAAGGPFELVTGTPPYLPKEHGTLPPDSQKAHARFELRGGVEAYAEAGARVLAPTGALVMCAGARAEQRMLCAADRAGLSVLEVLEVIPSPRKGVLFSVWTLGRERNAADLVRKRFHARDAQGARTEQSAQVRAFFGLPIAHAEASSPLQRVRGRAVRHSEQAR